MDRKKTDSHQKKVDALMRQAYLRGYEEGKREGYQKCYSQLFEYVADAFARVSKEVHEDIEKVGKDINNLIRSKK